MNLNGLKLPYDVALTLVMAISTKTTHYEKRLNDPAFNQDKQAVEFYKRELANLKTLSIIAKMECNE